MILELCKGVHCVDLGKSFQTHIHLQNFVSTQPRASPLKFARSSRVTERPSALRLQAREGGAMRLRAGLRRCGPGSVRGAEEKRERREASICRNRVWSFAEVFESCTLQLVIAVPVGVYDHVLS